MRAFVFLLVLANLLLFAWSRNYLGTTGSDESFRLREQIQSERVLIVAKDEAPPRQSPAGKLPENKAPAEEVCLRIEELAADAAERLEQALSERLPAFKGEKREIRPASASFWVHIPPLKTRRDAENKAAELKKLGLKDFYIVQEEGGNNRAISLGLFSSRESALAFVEALRDKGVRSAKIAERTAKPAWVQLDLRGPAAQAAEFERLLPEIIPEARTAVCKLPVSPAQ